MSTPPEVERIAMPLPMPFSADLGDFAAFNAEYKCHFDGRLPVRSTVEAKLCGGARIEIEVQAAA